MREYLIKINEWCKEVYAWAGKTVMVPAAVRYMGAVYTLAVNENGLYAVSERGTDWYPLIAVEGDWRVNPEDSLIDTGFGRLIAENWNFFEKEIRHAAAA